MMGNFGFNQIGIIGFFFMLLWFTLIIVGVIGFARWIFFQANGKNIPSPLDILKNRYAKGEIDKKEFEEMKRDIM